MLKTDSYAVFGNPIAHSLSPVIHSAFAKQTGQDLIYRAIKAPTTDFDKTLTRFFDEDGAGANVTLPFKVEAFEKAQQLTERAKRAGAVNTLFLQEGLLTGDNTDGVGLCFDINRGLGSLAGATVLLIGAGGAARGSIGPLLEAGVSQIVICNRTLGKAQQLANAFEQRVVACSLQQASDYRLDIVINSTSSSISGELPAISSAIFEKASLSYDMFYQKKPTAFLQWASEHNTQQKLMDGLGMLVAQAAESFFIWRGVRPDIAPVMHSIRERL